MKNSTINGIKAIIIVLWLVSAFNAVAIYERISGVSSAPLHSPGTSSSYSSPIGGPDSYPTYEQMQEWCGAPVDGIWGPVSDRLYRAKLAEQYGNEMALSLWPEAVE